MQAINLRTIIKPYCFIWWSVLRGKETFNRCKKLLNSDNSWKLTEVPVAQVVYTVQRRKIQKVKRGNITYRKKRADICLQ